ncbi:MAG: PEPxxWA-CTERM sorting domain-containing protein [Sphingomonadaceae bacterium]
MKSYVAGALALLMTTTAANATVLDFSGNICDGLTACTNGARIDQSYGDSADIDVFFVDDSNGTGLSLGGNGSSLFFWDNNYNELTNVAYGQAGGAPLVFLDPLRGQSVTLNSFRLGAWPQTTRLSQVTVIDGFGATLFSSGPITVGTGNVSTLFTVNITSANGIGIQFGPDGFNVGIDSIDFTVGPAAVPEPQSWMLMLAGFVLVGSLLRKRSRQRVSYS